MLFGSFYFKLAKETELRQHFNQSLDNLYHIFEFCFVCTIFRQMEHHPVRTICITNMSDITLAKWLIVCFPAS